MIGITPTKFVAIVQVSHQIAQYWQEAIFAQYGEVWEITYNRDFTYTAVDMTVPDKPEDYGTFNTATVLEDFILAQFPALDK